MPFLVAACSTGVPCMGSRESLLVPFSSNMSVGLITILDVGSLGFCASLFGLFFLLPFLKL